MLHPGGTTDMRLGPRVTPGCVCQPRSWMRVRVGAYIAGGTRAHAMNAPTCSQSAARDAPGCIPCSNTALGCTSLLGAAGGGPPGACQIQQRECTVEAGGAPGLKAKFRLVLWLTQQSCRESGSGSRNTAVHPTIVKERMVSAQSTIPQRGGAGRIDPTRLCPARPTP